MASSLTINVSAAASAMIPVQSAQATHVAQRVQQASLTPEQIARASQIASEKVAQVRLKEDTPTIRIPKRAEPGYSALKHKKKPGSKPTEEEKEPPPANDRQEMLDLKA